MIDTWSVAVLLISSIIITVQGIVIFYLIDLIKKIRPPF